MGLVRGQGDKERGDKERGDKVKGDKVKGAKATDCILALKETSACYFIRNVLIEFACINGLRI